MHLGIDASNVRAGGGVTYLTELLHAAKPNESGISEVFIWGSASTLRKFEDRKWMQKRHEPYLDLALPHRVYWQKYLMSERAKSENCDMLFIPGSSYSGGFRPFVTTCQNMLPFEYVEVGRYGFSWMFLKLMLLRFIQTKTFRKANGLIYLTQYAQHQVSKIIGTNNGDGKIISHGINRNFSCRPKKQYSISTYSLQNPFRILYVSVITVYKHQWKVAEAIAKLRKIYPIEIEFVGPAYKPSLKKLQQVMNKLDPDNEFIRYSGAIAYKEIHHKYKQADMFVYASSCENQPIILLEAMAAGLPIASSNRGPMPEVLGEAGVYFDPEHSMDIQQSLQQLIENPKLREEKAWSAYKRVHNYSWQKSARDTFDYIALVYKDYKQDGI